MNDDVKYDGHLLTKFLWFCDVYGAAAGAAVDYAMEPPPTTGIRKQYSGRGWEFDGQV